MSEISVVIAFDTNMLVRALIADHADQVAVVRELVSGNTVFISRTVLLESEWVLRTRYQKSRIELNAFFVALLETDNAMVEDAEAISHALDWYQKGADFADALHLAVCGTAVLHTFDRDFCKAAREAGITPEVRVWDV